MKKKTSGDKPPRTKKRKRRTIEELIADLEEEKKALIERLKAKELQTSPAYKAATTAVKHLDKASELAKEEGESELRRALLAARDALAPHLEEKGVRLPKARRPRGPKPRS